MPSLESRQPCRSSIKAELIVLGNGAANGCKDAEECEDAMSDCGHSMRSVQYPDSAEYALEQPRGANCERNHSTVVRVKPLPFV